VLVCEGRMALRSALRIGVPLAAVLLVCGAARADGYRADQFLTLDLAKAVLSPTPLGPLSHFEPVPVQAKADTARSATPSAAAQTATAGGSATSGKATAAHVPAAQMQHHRLAQRRRGNPLDAQASASRARIQVHPVQAHGIQAWPCRSGGICQWKSER
jgi:hypothetical protein